MDSLLAAFHKAVLSFSKPVNCREYVLAPRWPNAFESPRCESKNVTFLEKCNRWQCTAHHDARRLTSRTGMIFEDFLLDKDDNRKGENDGQRFDSAIRQIVTNRLMWDQFNGKLQEPQTWAA